MDELTTGDTAKQFPIWKLFAHHFLLAKSGKQGKAVQLHKFASSVNRALFTTFAHSLVGVTSPIPFEHHLAMITARSF